MPIESRRPPGFWCQLRIILWKNTILYYRNISGFICELLMISAFTCCLYLLIDVTTTEYEQSHEVRASKIIHNINQDSYLRHGYIYYYPESELTDKLMLDVSATFKSVKSNLLGVKSTNLIDFSVTNTTDLFAFVIFSESVRNVSFWPTLIEYKIYMTVSLRKFFD